MLLWVSRSCSTCLIELLSALSQRSLYVTRVKTSENAWTCFLEQSVKQASVPRLFVF